MTPSAEPAGECGTCVSLKRACAAWPGPDGTGHPYENDTPLCGFHASELQLELARLKERAERFVIAESFRVWFIERAPSALHLPKANKAAFIESALRQARRALEAGK